MPPFETLYLIYVTVVAVLGAGAIVALALHFQARRQVSARSLMREAEASIAFLFDDTDLIDATPAARALMRQRDRYQTDWDMFLAVFGPRFPHLRQGLAGLASEGRQRITSPDDPGVWLDAELWDGLARLSFHDEMTGGQAQPGESMATAAIEAELATLRSLAEDAPQLIWQEDLAGAVIWANRAYLDLVTRAENLPPDSTPVWPPANLFRDLDRPGVQGRPLVRRTPILIDRLDEPLWFEVTTIQRDATLTHFGIDANAVVRAEKTQRNFVQTLGKTFAQLSIGLAIFDRKRQLLIFNPALTTLTGLPFEFLSGRPQINMVLDKLREARMLPEPKNYMSWREEFAALESAAKDGTYCENWDLPNGQTYRVTGRPHPDGAVAFLFEDISAEVLLTRRFRSEIDTGRAVIDAMDEAVAVFSGSGTLTLTNAAYTRLWGAHPEARLADVGINDQVRLWQDRCTPTPIWGSVRDFVGGSGDRTAWQDTVHLDDGRRVICRFASLPGGATLAGFRIAPDVAQIVTPAKPAKTLRQVRA